MTKPCHECLDQRPRTYGSEARKAAIEWGMDPETFVDALMLAIPSHLSMAHLLTACRKLRDDIVAGRVSEEYVRKFAATLGVDGLGIPWLTTKRHSPID